MIVKIVTGPLNYDITKLYKKDESEYIIGVDQGCKMLLSNSIKIDLALGDFDSLDIETYREVRKYAKKVIVHPSEKKYTDTFLAIKEALLLDYSEILIYGGLGKRFDHTFANINLLKLGNIKIINEDTVVYMLDPGVYKIENDKKYISFFAIEEVCNLNLVGFKYDLENIFLDTENPLCISNEGKGSLSFDSGLLMVIEQDE